jgi:hypothetical protein
MWLKLERGLVFLNLQEVGPTKSASDPLVALLLDKVDLGLDVI